MSSQESSHKCVTERDRLRLLLDVTNDIVAILDMRQMLIATSKRIRTLLAHDYLSVAVYDERTDQLRSCALDFPESRGHSPRTHGSVRFKFVPNMRPWRIICASRSSRIHRIRNISSPCGRTSPAMRRVTQS